MSIPVAINVAIGTSNTDLYTAGAALAQMTSLTLTNTTGSDITVDIWKRNAGNTTSWFIASTLTVPAHDNRIWRGGLVTFENTGEKLRAVAASVGVDAVGSVIEY